MSEKTACNEFLRIIDERLTAILRESSGAPSVLRRAVKYALFPGGKRIRPLLLLATAQSLSVPMNKALHCATGIELIHTFSLIHDDLPCMDNDQFRRGRPTVHVAFGEPIALLAGDALLAMGLGEIAKSGSADAVYSAAKALDAGGMAGGQALDILWQGKVPSATIKAKIDRKKTGELFSLCFELPLLFAETSSRIADAFIKAGRAFGSLFQALDDISDNEQEIRAMKVFRTSFSAFERALSEIPDHKLLFFLVHSLCGNLQK
ncbi:MAG: polyprenyl synthetase family protein [Candidatus Ratteibacteria bacterium]|jgi:geranylgeranyl pyrophosphate synthase